MRLYVKAKRQRMQNVRNKTYKSALNGNPIKVYVNLAAPVRTSIWSFLLSEIEYFFQSQYVSTSVRSYNNNAILSFLMQLRVTSTNAQFHFCNPSVGFTFKWHTTR